MSKNPDFSYEEHDRFSLEEMNVSNFRPDITVCDTCRLQTCRLALGLAKLELLLAKLALRIGIGI